LRRRIIKFGKIRAAFVCAALIALYSASASAWENVSIHDLELFGESDDRTSGIEARGAFMSSQNFYFERVVFQGFTADLTPTPCRSAITVGNSITSNSITAVLSTTATRAFSDVTIRMESRRQYVYESETHRDR
jgi:hypothetical protein